MWYYCNHQPTSDQIRYECLKSSVNVQYQPNPRIDFGGNRGRGLRNRRELMRQHKLTDPPRLRAHHRRPQGSRLLHFGGQKIAWVVAACSSHFDRLRNPHDCSQWRTDSIACLQSVASPSRNPSHGHSYILHHSVPQQLKHYWRRDQTYRFRLRYNHHFHPAVRDLQHCTPCIPC